MKPEVRQLELGAWMLTGLALFVGAVAWLQAYGSQLAGLGIYQIFPLFGLTAFSLMWGQYVVTAVKQYYGISSPNLRKYYAITSLMVFVTILLHPGLLMLQLFMDNLGLPPGSYFEYVGPMMVTSIILGEVALFVFLAFELKRFFADKSWLKYVLMASDIAIILIYIHALRLGGQLQTGWYRAVWIFYGLTLLLALGYIYYRRLTEKDKILDKKLKK